jgi:hypothetical protein
MAPSGAHSRDPLAPSGLRAGHDAIMMEERALARVSNLGAGALFFETAQARLLSMRKILRGA